MSILLSVPTRGAIQWTTVTRMEEIRDRSPVAMSPILYESDHLSVALTRNKIVAKFMDGDWDALVMVDDDVTPPPHFLDIERYLDDFDMVGIPYPMFAQNTLDFVIFSEHPEGYKLVAPQPGVHEVDAIGTGCVMISRRVFEKLGRVPFKIEHDPSKTVLSDDFLFCKDMQAAGLKIGYFWDGWYADHCTLVSLAPLKESALARELQYV